MKKLNFVLLLSIFLCLIGGCTKDEVQPDPLNLSDDSALKGAKVSKYIAGTDITVQLRGDLEAGLDVKLPAGHFYISESIINLDYPGGTIKGAGKDLTYIQAAQDFKPLPNPGLGNAPVSAFLNFANVTGEVTIKDMTFLVLGPAPAQGHVNPFIGYSTCIDNVIVINGPSWTATVKDIRIKGEYVGDVEGAYRGYNLIFPLIGTGVGYEGPIHFEVKDCEIEGAGFFAIEFYESHGGSGSMIGNKISNCSLGIWLGWANEGSEVVVKNNEFEIIKWTPNTPIIRRSPEDNYCIKDNILNGIPLADDCQMN